MWHRKLYTNPLAQTLLRPQPHDIPCGGMTNAGLPRPVDSGRKDQHRLISKGQPPRKRKGPTFWAAVYTSFAAFLNIMY